MKQYIETEHLILRDWAEADIPAFARLNSDGKVMEYFLKPLSRQETEAFYQRIQQEFASYGYGLYAVEEKVSNCFIGYVGFHNVPPEMDFAPAVEIGWRLLPEYWGRGYATEAATACLEYAQTELKFQEVCSFTSLPNKRSENVMRKIGMSRVKEFNHPLVDANHPLYRHVLYKSWVFQEE